jgi:hypothetical protein
MVLDILATLVAAVAVLLAFADAAKGIKRPRRRG